MPRLRDPRVGLVVAWFLLLSPWANADDWPMWRYDAQRTAASSNELPDSLTVRWTKELTPRRQAWDDPLNLDLMTYDRVFEPIVMDGRLFVGFNDHDKMVALDADTGKEIWTFYTEAPVRLPPVAWDGRVFFCSDDGFLYCVDASSGELRWKFSGAPNAQHAIGNGRLTSAWPARGGPVIRDETVYFAASIWPFMGTFIYALDADSGEVKWVNDSTGAQYIKQPHSAPSFAGVAPQGALVATEELLLVSGGRSVPAALNRADGKLRYFEMNAGGKGTGGSFLAADENHFYVHTREKGTRAFHLEDGIKTAFMPNEPVLHNGMVYSAESDDGESFVRAYNSDEKMVWEIEADGSGDLILAGDKLVAAGGGTITQIRIPRPNRRARIIHSMTVDEQIERLIVADRTLFAVSIDGHLLAMGEGDASSETESVAPSPDTTVESEEYQSQVADLLAAGDPQGYALWFGGSDSPRAKSMAAQSPFVQLAMVDDDGKVVDQMRRELDRAGLYGRVTVHHSDAASFKAPQYVANMLFVDHDRLDSAASSLIASLYQSVRPYGGVMYLLTDNDRPELAATVEKMDLEQAEVELGKQGVIVRRVGALPGSADWTHQYGDIANTIKSDDRRVKLPLGILWFGGSSNLDVLPRHGHGPPEQVVGGRLFIQGINSLSARDVYTGRVLWKREFEDLGTFDVYYDKTYEDVPLDTKYNQVHIPGANGRGTNYVVTDDRVYILEGSVCHALDPASGQTLEDFRLPTGRSDESKSWGYIGVYKDVLIGGVGFAMYRRQHGLTFDSDKDLKDNKAGFGSKSLDRAGSAALVGFDRHTGDQLWKVEANHSFWHNGIVAGGDKIYCLDKNPKLIEDAMRRRGKPNPASYRIVAFDYRTGQEKWQVNDGIFGTWLGYSEEYDLLLQAGAKGSDRLTTEVGQGMAVYNAEDGSLRWENKSLNYAGPCILHNDLIITNANSYSESAGAFYLQDGKQKLVKNPLTGEMQPWKVTRAYGCNNIVASENLLTFRSGAAGFYDLLTNGGTGNLGGFKSGCTSNLVVANGVLNAPDYTRTCSCAYQNQTSLALVHMPEIDLWSVNAQSATSYGESIQQLGINFGAPGDRRDANGLLWIEYPIIAGDSPPVSIEMNPQASFYQHHSSSMKDVELPWISASGIEGVTEMRIRMKLKDEYDLSRGIMIDHANDDAEEDEDGKVALADAAIELVENSGRQLVGLRFNKINLDRNAVVRHAHIQWTCEESSDDKTSLIITAEDTGNAQRFNSDDHDLSSRSKTSQEVGWRPKPWKQEDHQGPDQQTPDLAALVRAVIGRADWKPGNSIAFLISGNGKRIAHSYKGGKDAAPRLVIESEQSELVDAPPPPARYDIRLFFAAPPASTEGLRVFDVHAQGERIAENITLDPAGTGQQKDRVHRIENIAIADELDLRFVPKQGTPVLSGIEIIRQPELSGR